MKVVLIIFVALQACIQVCPKNPANFNVDNVRVAKLLGGGLHNSTIVRGMVLKSDAVGSIKNMEKAKVISPYFLLLFSLLFDLSILMNLCGCFYISFSRSLSIKVGACCHPFVT